MTPPGSSTGRRARGHVATPGTSRVSVAWVLTAVLTAGCGGGTVEPRPSDLTSVQAREARGSHSPTTRTTTTPTTTTRTPTATSGRTSGTSTTSRPPGTLRSPTPPRTSSASREPPHTATQAPTRRTALPSPLRIPLPTDELFGRPTDSALADLSAEIATACGGDQCVSVVTTVDDTDDWPCASVRRVVGLQREETADGTRSFVEAERGGTVTVVLSGPCPRESSTEADPSPPTEATAGTTGAG